MASAGGGCPYKPAKATEDNAAPEPESKCPVLNGKRKVYNVYSQEVNPDNNMPANPNQLPRETQSKPLSTGRVKSTIPKGGTDGTWTYPSPQMFFNALKRKGKGEDVHEHDMHNVVAVHNSMNEQTWNQILKWESIRSSAFKAVGPSLLRFIGRPHDISPKAWFLSTFTSKPKPFDRHDWTVQRGDEEVRYVIDYYYMDDGEGGNTTMPMTATGAFDKGALDEKLIYVDARPALDSWSGIVARAKEFFGLESISDPWVDARKSQRTESREAQPLSHSLDVDPSSMEERFRPEALMKMEQWVNDNCAKQFEIMNNVCTGDNANADECAQAAFALRLCTARVICEAETSKFLTSSESASDPEALAQAWEPVESFLQEYTQRAAEAMDHYQRAEQEV